MIDVEERGLRAFKEYGTAFTGRDVQVVRSVPDKLAQTFA
jgi:hypothetical protein